MEKLYIINSGGTVDVTQLVPSISWSGDKRQRTRTLSFGLLSSPVDQNIPPIKCELGNAVTFKQDDRILFQGNVFARQKNTGSSVIDFTCYDRGFYLKNEAVYKFTNMTPEDITKRVCEDFGIPIGSAAETGVKISRNFIGVSIYSIIQTVYTLAAKTTGEAYFIRFEGLALDVKKMGFSDETLIIKGGSNLMSYSTTESIENMINQVAIYNNNDELISTVNDTGLIGLYGLMQDYLRQDGNEDATQRANRILADNGIEQKISVESIGNSACLTGNAIVVQEPYTGVYGLFYIESDTHTWNNGKYLNKLTINFKKLMDEQEAGSLPNATGSKTASKTQWENKNKAGG